MPCAAENWNSANIMFDTVFDPAMNAPNAPTIGANRGQLAPVAAAIPSARVIGMDATPSEPELMNTCTIGTASSNAGAAASIVRPEIAQARP